MADVLFSSFKNELSVFSLISIDTLSKATLGSPLRNGARMGLLDATLSGKLEIRDTVKWRKNAP